MAPTWRHVQYSLSELSHAHQDGYGGDDKDGDAGSNERDDSFTPVQPRHSRLLLHLIGFQPRGHSISPLPKLMMLAAIKNTTTSATTTSLRSWRLAASGRHCVPGRKGRYWNFAF